MAHALKMVAAGVESPLVTPAGVVRPNSLAASGRLAVFVTCLPSVQKPIFPDGRPSGLCTDVIGAAPRAHKYNLFVVDHLGMPDSAGLATQPAEPSLQAQ